MFTGIIEEVGVVRSKSATGMVLQAAIVLEGVQLGDSISINGACLTVTTIGNDTFSVDVVPETWRRTDLGDLHPGDLVNLERPLTPTSRMGGHFVQGHVDGTGRIAAMEPEGEALNIRIQTAEPIARYVVEKGFIAIDGISLTVTQSGRDSFSVSLIPYTREHTNFKTKKQGDAVNLEIDILAKYAERFLTQPAGIGPTPERGQ